MNFTLIVHSAPHSGQGSHTALAFAKSLLNGGHDLQRVFFYQDGAQNALSTRVTPQGESDVLTGWQTLAHDHGFELAVCIAAALRRGVLNHEEADRYERTGANTAEPFVIVGLGQLIDAVVEADQCITFVN